MEEEEIRMREELQKINNYKNYIISINATAFEYDGWSDDFKLKEIREAYVRFRNDLSYDFRKFTKEELLSLGFSYWDDNLIVMPLWAYHICEDGLILTSINDDTAVKGKDDIDTDVRGGCLAYGFTVKELFKRERKMKLDKIEKEAQS